MTKKSKATYRKLVSEVSDLNVMALGQQHLERDTNKVYLANRGMRVYKKEELTKKCYLCKSQGSLDNQLIPRWISKETMVCICAGCYERTNNWIKDEPRKLWNWWGTNKEAGLIASAVSKGLGWQKGNTEKKDTE